MKSTASALIPLLLLTACTSFTRPQVKDNLLSKHNAPEYSHKSAIPYPGQDEQTQTDQLGIRIARLEHEIESLNRRIQQIEKQGKSTANPTKKQTGQRLDDQKLKSHYLANGGTIPEDSDPITQKEARLYERASKYYRSGNYAAAAAVLKEADGGNGNETARRNMYLLLQSNQRMGKCESVIEIGSRYANRFRNSPQAPDAMFSIGQCQYKLQQKDIARNTWRKLIQIYPGSEAAKRAAVSIKQR